jgi:hypothetical protein
MPPILKATVGGNSVILMELVNDSNNGGTKLTRLIG